MNTSFKNLRRGVALTLVTLLLAMTPISTIASSHMDAPLITLDDPANTTDVYAFVSTRSGIKYLTTALAVYPFEEPGIGPNNFRFDDDVRYEIHVAMGADLAAGRATFTYRFRFTTQIKNNNTILQAFTGVVNDVDDASQNLIQTYTVTRIDRRTSPSTSTTLTSTGKTPPNNQGLVTPFYNQGNSGENLAKDGVNRGQTPDKYTAQAIKSLSNGHRVFAGQRDDGFYADIQSLFDLDFAFSGPNKPFDSQGGFNVHTIALDIPVSQIGGPSQIVGVYATTSRRSMRVLNSGPTFEDDSLSGSFVQVGRQGNPLFNEGLVANKDKDRYNRTQPTSDNALFRNYAETPELAAALGLPANLQTGRTDIAGIFIPDLIKVDLSTGPARLAGGGASTPDDPGFHRLSIFGGDTLTSTIQPGFGGGAIPGGWPNGRRFGDDVVDIAVMALASDLRTSQPILCSFCNPSGNVDKVVKNDVGYNKVFPYAATPLNGRNHGHHAPRP